MQSTSVLTTAQFAGRNLSIRSYTSWTLLVSLCVIIAFIAIFQFGMGRPTQGLLIGILGLILGLSVASMGKPPIHPLSIVGLVALSHTLLFVLRPAYSIFFQNSINIFSGNTYDQYFVYAALAASVGLISFCVGYRRLGATQYTAIRRNSIRPVSKHDWPVYSCLLWITVALGLFLYALYIAKTGPGRWLEAVLGGRSEASRGITEGVSAYLYSGNQFAFGALIFLALQAALSGRKKTAWITGFLLIAASFPSFAYGSRSVFLPLLVALFYLCYILRPSILKLRNFLTWGPLAFVVFLIAPRIWRDGTVQDQSLSTALHEAFSIESSIGSFLGGLDTAMVDAFTIQLESHADGSLDYSYGTTYLYLLLGVIPRSLWADKPVPVDSYLNELLFPQTYYQGVGFSFSIYSEPFLNFSWIGLIIVMGILGMAAAKLSQACIATGKLQYAFVLIMASSYVFPLFRGSISFDMQRILIPILPAVLSILVAQFIVASSSRKPRMKC